MKRLIFAGLLCLTAFGAAELTTPKAEAHPVHCHTVRCGACPEGTVLSPVGNDCCRCVPI